MSESEQSYSPFPDFSSGDCGSQLNFGQIPLPEALYDPRFVQWGGNFDHELDSHREHLLGSLVRYGNELKRGDMSPEKQSCVEELDYILGRIIEISADANPSAVSGFELPTEVRGKWFRIFFYDREDEPGQNQPGLLEGNDPDVELDEMLDMSSEQWSERVVPGHEMFIRKLAQAQRRQFADQIRLATDQAVLDISTAALGSDDMT